MAANDGKTKLSFWPTGSTLHKISASLTLLLIFAFSFTGPASLSVNHCTVGAFDLCDRVIVMNTGRKKT